MPLVCVSAQTTTFVHALTQTPSRSPRFERTRVRLCHRTQLGRQGSSATAAQAAAVVAAPLAAPLTARVPRPACRPREGGAVPVRTAGVHRRRASATSPSGSASPTARSTRTSTPRTRSSPRSPTPSRPTCCRPREAEPHLPPGSPLSARIERANRGYLRGYRPNARMMGVLEQVATFTRSSPRSAAPSAATTSSAARPRSGAGRSGPRRHRRRRVRGQRTRSR